MKNITFIAGGSKGLGAALVESLLTANHEVLEFSRTGNHPQHINCDFNLPEEAKAIFNETFQKYKDIKYHSINLVINTAVLAPFGSIATADNNQINSHLNININATVYLVQAFLSQFQEMNCQKSMAYVSSGAATRPIPGLAMYSASKAFFDRLIDTIAAEQNEQSFPVKCMVINPGVMNTGMQTEIRSQSAEDFPMVGMWNELHQKGQLAVPSDVAAVCLDLLLNTGINGGYYTAQEFLKK